jgi:hypothetical protein
MIPPHRERFTTESANKSQWTVSIVVGLGNEELPYRNISTIETSSISQGTTADFLRSGH